MNQYNLYVGKNYNGLVSWVKMYYDPIALRECFESIEDHIQMRRAVSDSAVYEYKINSTGETVDE